MKRWLLRLGLAAITFTLGYGVHFLTTFVGTDNERSPKALPYCQVARNAESYHDKDILVKAQISVDEFGVVVNEDCDPVDAMSAWVVFDEKYSLNGQAYVDHVLLTHRKRQVQTAQALIKGRFNANASTGCYAPQFGIEAETIHLLSNLKDQVQVPHEGPVLRTKH